MIRRRLLIEWCAIALVTAAIVAGLLLSRTTARIDDALYDVLVGFRAPPPSGRILIVAIDDPSVAALGRWPWPRSIHARLLERLATAKPAAIAYDVLFTEPGPPIDDAQLAAALKEAPPTGLPVLFETPGSNGRAIDVTPPVEPIRGAAAGLGHVALLPDEDGTARAALLSFQADGRDWPHLMEWAYRATLHHPSPAFLRGVASGDSAVAIPFQPQGGAFRTISFASVLAGEVPDAFLRDRIILIGATAGGLGDRDQVPLRSGGSMAGIEVQANLLNDLLADRLVQPLPIVLQLALSLLPSLLLLLAFWRLRPARALILSVLLILAAVAAPAVLLVGFGLWWPPAPALAGLLLVYPLWGWRRLQAVDRAIGQELAIFAREPMPVASVRAIRLPLDPIGGQTEQLRASIAATRDLRRLVSDTIEGVGAPLFVTGLDDRLLLANAPAEALLGDHAEGEPLSALLSTLSGTSLSPDALPDELEIPGGRIFSLRRSPLSGGAGEPRGWILLLADISAIRHAEREREEALQFLSHDMRSPQASIITLLEEDGPVQADGGTRARILGHARRTLALAENFVQLARLSVARFAPEEMDLADALADAADELWSQAKRRGIRIETPEPDGTFLMPGERHALARALSNLIDNAVKFSPDGGTILCTLSGQASGEGPAGRRIECVIEDEGAGIPPEMRDSLFDRFGRTRKTGSSPSSGLGLAYVRAAVERHGGHIRHEPRLPHGTRFLLEFPAI